MNAKAGVALTIAAVLMLVASTSYTGVAAKQVIVDDRSSVHGTITIEVSRPDLRCDGDDSTRIVITRRRDDGSPAVGDKQGFGLNPGSFTVLNAQREPDGTYRYDARGQLRIRFSPTNNGNGYWALGLPSYPGDRMVHSFPCPFSDSRTYTVSGDIWNDQSADGEHDRRERNLPRFGLKIQCGGCWEVFGTPWHYQRTDRLGQYEWIGLVKGGFRVAPWEMCLDDRKACKWSIVSVNGSPVAPTACITVHIAEPGNQDFSLGVRRN